MATTIERQQVLEIVQQALRNLNETLPEDEQVEVGPTTPLFGPDSRLDSLSLVSVIIDVETTLITNCDASISLMDDRSMGREVSPFRDVGSLTDYVMELLLETPA